MVKIHIKKNYKKLQKKLQKITGLLDDFLIEM